MRAVFEVDPEDELAVSYYTWHVDHSGYARTNIGKRPRTKRVRLHTFLMGKAPKGLEWDHIDRNKMNNRRSNLRAVDHAANCVNLNPRPSSVRRRKWSQWR